MKRIPSRWALSIFHLAMDLMLVAVLVARLRDAVDHPPLARFRAQPFLATAYEQPFERFDPRGPAFIEPVLLLITGTLPAGIVSILVMGAAGNFPDMPYNPTSLLWLGFYEALATSFWFFASRAPSARWWCVSSIFVRILACSITSSRFQRAGPGIQAVFWLIVAIYITTVGICRLVGQRRALP